MLVGIDSGGTAAKVAVYAEDGTCLGSATSRLPVISARPRWAERDMAAMWRDCVHLLRVALGRAGASGSDVTAVGLCGHSDGLYPVDAELRPVRNAILATDSRTVELVAEWRERNLIGQVRALAGQHLAEPSQAALFAWLVRHDPDTVARMRWLLTAKDWLRLCLTARVGSDFSEVNASFGALDGSRYEPRIAELLGIPEVMELLPPPAAATEVAGRVTPVAAAQTGLRAGTPVVHGAHDVVAAALGAGVVRADRYCVVAGTWGVNEVLAEERVIDARWQSRRWLDGDRWLHMSASPASTSNLDWFLRNAGDGGAVGGLERVNAEVADALERPGDVVFVPFLFGSPVGASASAAFLGLTGWHTRSDLARAVFEGVIFNHVGQLDALRQRFGPMPLRFTGGGARSRVWGQLLADAADAEVEVPEAAETGCWGAALCAAVGTRLYSSLESAVDATFRVAARYSPRQDRHAVLADGYRRYRAVLERLDDVWPLLHRRDR